MLPNRGAVGRLASCSPSQKPVNEGRTCVSEETPDLSEDALHQILRFLAPCAEIDEAWIPSHNFAAPGDSICPHQETWANDSRDFSPNSFQSLPLPFLKISISTDEGICACLVDSFPLRTTTRPIKDLRQLASEVLIVKERCRIFWSSDNLGRVTNQVSE